MPKVMAPLRSIFYYINMIELLNFRHFTPF